MKSPETILTEEYGKALKDGSFPEKLVTVVPYDTVIKAIRQAQIEAIEECAGIAGRVLKHEHQEPLLDEINDEILQLKNQVK